MRTDAGPAPQEEAHGVGYLVLRIILFALDAFYRSAIALAVVLYGACCRPARARLLVVMPPLDGGIHSVPLSTR